jgi:DNA polymerase III psi subunit
MIDDQHLHLLLHEPIYLVEEQKQALPEASEPTHHQKESETARVYDFIVVAEIKDENERALLSAILKAIKLTPEKVNVFSSLDSGIFAKSKKALIFGFEQDLSGILTVDKYQISNANQCVVLTSDTLSLLNQAENRALKVNLWTALKQWA